MTAKFCGECGKALASGARFCTGCGRAVPGAAVTAHIDHSPVASEGASVAADLPIVEQATARQRASDEWPGENEGAPRSWWRSPAALVGACLAAVLAIVLGVFMLIGDDGEEAANGMSADAAGDATPNAASGTAVPARPPASLTNHQEPRSGPLPDLAPLDISRFVNLAPSQIVDFSSEPDLLRLAREAVPDQQVIQDIQDNPGIIGQPELSGNHMLIWQTCTRFCNFQFNSSVLVTGNGSEQRAIVCVRDSRRTGSDSVWYDRQRQTLRIAGDCPSTVSAAIQLYSNFLYEHR